MSVPQHLTEQLELDLSPLDYMMKCYPDFKEREEMRKIIGRYGLTGKQQVTIENREARLRHNTIMVPQTVGYGSLGCFHIKQLFPFKN